MAWTRTAAIVAAGAVALGAGLAIAQDAPPVKMFLGDRTHGMELYQARCASCHDAGGDRTPRKDALIAMGLVVTYTTTGIFNFSHGAIAMFSAFTFWTFWQKWHVNVILSLIIVLLILAPLFGMFIELALMRPLRGAPFSRPVRAGDRSSAGRPAAGASRGR